MSKSIEIFRDIRDAIEPQVRACKGVLECSTDLDEALGKLATSPSGWRVILVWDGFGSHEHAREGMSTLRCKTIINANKGLSLPGVFTHQDGHRSGDPAFMDMIEKVSLWMRSIRWPNGHDVDCAGLVLESSDWVSDTPANALAHSIDWTVAMALPPFEAHIVVSREPETQTPIPEIQ